MEAGKGSTSLQLLIFFFQLINLTLNSFNFFSASSIPHEDVSFLPQFRDPEPNSLFSVTDRIFFFPSHFITSFYFNNTIVILFCQDFFCKAPSLKEPGLL